MLMEIFVAAAMVSQTPADDMSAVSQTPLVLHLLML
jgi:hypothetical protein